MRCDAIRFLVKHLLACAPKMPLVAVRITNIVCEQLRWKQGRLWEYI